MYPTSPSPAWEALHCLKLQTWRSVQTAIALAKVGQVVHVEVEGDQESFFVRMSLLSCYCQPGVACPSLPVGSEAPVLQVARLRHHPSSLPCSVPYCPGGCPEVEEEPLIEVDTTGPWVWHGPGAPEQDGGSDLLVSS